MSEVAPEVVERMVALVRQIGSMTPRTTAQDYWFPEAAAIVALLPEPVDPDLIEARKLAFDFAGTMGPKPPGILDGEMDDSEALLALYAAIKRGRELAAQS